MSWRSIMQLFMYNEINQLHGVTILPILHTGSRFFYMNLVKVESVSIFAHRIFCTKSWIILYKGHFWIYVHAMSWCILRILITIHMKVIHSTFQGPHVITHSIQAWIGLKLSFNKTFLSDAVHHNNIIRSSFSIIFLT